MPPLWHSLKYEVGIPLKNEGSPIKRIGVF
jgi:hypothetical protein